MVAKTIDRLSKDNPKDQVAQYVNMFNTLQAKNQLKGVDISQLDFAKLKELIDTKSQEKTHTEVKKEIKVSGADKVFENDKVVVVIPKTHKASCMYGSNTKWCTTEKDPQHWNHYWRDRVTLYYILP
jgi:hypothetical protein